MLKLQINVLKNRKKFPYIGIYELFSVKICFKQKCGYRRSLSLCRNFRENDGP